ncbi:MAG: hypothetical protein PHE55_21455, partial [Methylococcaceae bacterium]|nr:hypothetical protein [Methylococcaceae bacterium]
YSLDLQTAWKAGAESAVAFKKVVRDGPKDSLLTVPSLPAVIPPTGAPFPDVFGFLGALITRIKIHKNYTDAIGAALKILPSKSPGVDPNTLQPVLAVELRAGHPNILWDKNGMDGIEIEVDRGTGSFVLLAFDTVPDYLDTAPLPAPGTSAIWKYRAIYRLHDERVGQWSQVLEVAVKGE